MKSYTDIEQSKKLAEILPLESADMYWWSSGKRYYIEAMDDGDFNEGEGHIRAWSLAALLKLIPKHILRKDKIHYGQTFIPSFRWEITPTAIYYTDGNNIMDYVSFRYGENNKELIDAVFEMVIKLKERNLI